ncbi:MAG: SpoIIE family protein phosphatase, partial [Bacteroidales bacterium]|nr:SpoIIE family protein phosphatase [Bacteroidales bacterium]
HFNPSEIVGGDDQHVGLVILDDGNVIISTPGSIVHHNGSKWFRYRYPDIPVSSSKNIIAYDIGRGKLIIGNDGADLYLFEYSDQNLQVYKDLLYQGKLRDNEKWFVSKDNKVVVHTNSDWIYYNTTDGLIDNPQSIHVNSRGHIWCVGSHSGIAATAYFTGSNWVKQTHPESSWKINYRAVHETPDCTMYFGVSAIDVEKNQTANIIRLSYDNLHDLKWDYFHGESKADKYSIYDFFYFRDTLYAINDFKANAILKDGSTKIFRKFFGQPQRGETSPEGSLWLATLNISIEKYDSNRISTFNLNHGLRSDIFVDVVAESDKRVWAVTDKNFVFFDGETWINDVFPEEFVFEAKAGNIVAGNNEVWINKTTSPWMMRTKAGTKVDPRFFISVRMRCDTMPPQTSIEHYDESVEYRKNTTIYWKGQDHWMHTPTDELLYSYRLNDEKWSSYSTQSYARFSNMSNGKYTFEVKAMDTFGNKEKSSAKITFEVLPPIWKRPWFVSLISFLVTIIIILWINIIKRNRRLQQNNVELKEQKEEIQVQNKEIQQQSEELATQNDAILEQKKQIEQSLNRLKVLSEFGKTLTATLKLDDIHEMMYRYIKSVLNVQAFGIGFFIEERNQIIYTNFIEEGETLPPFVKSLEDRNSLTAWCMNQQQPVIINDIEKEYQKYVPGLNIAATKKLSHSRLHLPLTVKEKKIGLLVVNSYERNAYSKDDFTNIQTLASYISIAMDNANAYEMINVKNRAINESINYAKSIQSAFMPTQAQLDKFFNCFVMFEPKDIVSGDFTWFCPVEKDKSKPLKAFLCVADCTGHGVPGALVSIVGSNLLNEIINIRGIHDPARVLEMVNDGFQHALKQDETRNNDGMDLALVFLEEDLNIGQSVEQTGFDDSGLPGDQIGSKLDKSSTRNQELDSPDNQLDGRTGKSKSRNIKITFSGAKNPCVIYRADKKELEILKGARKSIGGLRAKKSKLLYDKKELIIHEGDCIYLFTDGIIDQHNVKRERLSREYFLDILLEVASKNDLNEQKKRIETALFDFMQNEKQTDDISVVGIKF